MGPELWRCLHFPWQGNGDSAWKEFSCCLPPCSLTLPQLATSHCRLLRSRSWTPCCFLFFASPPPPRVAAGAAPWRERAVLGHCIPQTHLCPRDPPAPHGARRLPSRTGTSVIHCCRARWVPGSPGPCPLPRCPSLMVQSRGAPPAVAAPAVSAPASLGRGELIPGAATTLSLLVV
ncbi:uncharacterized protein ACIB01_013456 isoform 3-T3 [Guaruba guarouba]